MVMAGMLFQEPYNYLPVINSVHMLLYHAHLAPRSEISMLPLCTHPLERWVNTLAAAWSDLMTPVACPAGLSD